MGLWKASQNCHVLGVMLAGGEIVKLTDSQEKELGLGKYVTEAPDERARRANPESKKTVKVGFKHLVKAVPSEAHGRDSVAMDEGFIRYPPPRAMPTPSSVSADGIHSTQIEVRR